MSKNLIKKCLFLLLIIISLIVVFFIMKKYDAEGEKVLPYSIEKILVVSTVNGNVVDDPQNMWNVGVTQINDIYIYINKTLLDEDAVIKEIKLDNFTLNKAPQKGKVKLLRPTGELSNLYTYSEQDYFNSEIVYTGDKIDDMKSLEISNNGGMLGFRLSLEDLGEYVSNDAQEITYDGKLLSNLGIDIEQIKFNVSFDITITTSDDISFKGNLKLDLPLDTVIEEGSSNKEITNFDDVIFKRT